MTQQPAITVIPAGAGILDVAAVEISLTIYPRELSRQQDSYLATLWHVIQAAPAGFEHKAPGEIAEAIGREIIRRWLRTVEPELYHQQGHHYDWKQLTRFARWDGTEWVMRDEAFHAELNRRNDQALSAPDPAEHTGSQA